MDTSEEYAAARDAGDPLATYRDRFVGAAEPLVYFDGNSLGRPLAVTAERLARFTTQEWGGRLIRAWDEQWMDLPLELGDRLGRVVLGASAGQATIGDSTTVLLYKLVRGAVAHQRATDPDRDEVVVDRANFPTDRYVVEGIAEEAGLTVRWLEPEHDAGVTAELLAEVLSERTALVVLSHVAYRSAYLTDAPALTRAAHDAGALVLWDLCHSVGSVPLDLDAWEVDLAVGCTYKYLNGGPGSPAFGYVAARHLDVMTQPIRGWMGHAHPFTMGPEWTPSPGIRRFLSGTPSILAMQPLADMLEQLEGAGIDAVRAKSLALTAYTIDLHDAWLAPHGVRLASPRDPDRRGGHVTLDHPRMRPVIERLWTEDVIPDYREPGGLRVGLSPLSTSFAEVRRGMAAVREALASGS